MGSDSLDETDSAGNTNNASFNEYIFFGGKRIARRDSSSNVFYYISDHLGTSRVTVQAGQTTACYDADFYPYGGERIVTNTCPQNYKFTGKERDSESGLDDFDARHYSSSLGRFMHSDPLGMFAADISVPQSWNLYSYVMNNPLSFIDPDGLDCVYLNNAGNGVESVDRSSDSGECRQHEGTWFEGTVNSNSVRTDPNSDWVFAEGVVEPMGSNSQYSCGGSACGQDALDSFVNSVTGGPSSITVTDNSDTLTPGAIAVLGDVYKRTRIIADASDVAACTAVGVVFGNGTIPPPVTHAAGEGIARGLENPKTATAAARAYQTATDARFTAGGKFSKVLVPRTAKALRPVLATAGKAVSVAGWAYLGYEAYKSGKQCASQVK